MAAGTTFEECKVSLDFILIADWAISSADAGFSDEELQRFFKDGEAPAEFSEWVGEKYDLVRRSEWAFR